MSEIVQATVVAKFKMSNVVDRETLQDEYNNSIAECVKYILENDCLFDIVDEGFEIVSVTEGI